VASAPSEPSLIIERLTQVHDLSHFESSSATLNTWLKRYAWTNQRAESAKTYVAHRNDRVVGYHALVAGSVLKNEAPERIAQGLANHPIGVILLARLAVDKSEQGNGLGKALLRDALARISHAAELVGVRAVLVHAIDENARKFYVHHGFAPTPINTMHLMMLTKDLRASL
jgi:GNAT superfamily N-acetyltransferase